LNFARIQHSTFNIYKFIHEPKSSVARCYRFVGVRCAFSMHASLPMALPFAGIFACVCLPFVCILFAFCLYVLAVFDCVLRKIEAFFALEIGFPVAAQYTGKKCRHIQAKSKQNADKRQAHASKMPLLSSHIERHIERRARRPQLDRNTHSCGAQTGNVGGQPLENLWREFLASICLLSWAPHGRQEGALGVEQQASGKHRCGDLEAFAFLE